MCKIYAYREEITANRRKIIPDGKKMTAYGDKIAPYHGKVRDYGEKVRMSRPKIITYHEKITPHRLNVAADRKKMAACLASGSVGSVKAHSYIKKQSLQGENGVNDAAISSDLAANSKEIAALAEPAPDSDPGLAHDGHSIIFTVDRPRGRCNRN